MKRPGRPATGPKAPKETALVDSGVHTDSPQRRIQSMPKLRIVWMSEALLVLGSWAAADDVTLVPGSTVKQAISGRVRGQVQSESSTEVVVKLGATSTSVPVDQILSIR